MNCRRTVVVAMLGLFAACSTSPPPAAETGSPKDSPMSYRVLADEVQPGSGAVEYHVLVAEHPRHDAVDALLRFLYRHLMKRRPDPPAAASAFVYTNEVQFRTPPRSAIASVIKHADDLAPSFENNVPLEFQQQVAQALPHSDKGWKLEKRVELDEARKLVTLTQPFTEPGEDRYAEAPSFNQAMNTFTDSAQALFDKVPELRALRFIGRWRDQPVLKVELDRADYHRLRLAEVEEKIGQLHGRAFLELSMQRRSDAQIAKHSGQQVAALYHKILAQLGAKATASPILK